jgi:hypothetical protein
MAVDMSRSHHKHKKQGLGTKSVQKVFLPAGASRRRIEERRSSLSRRVQFWQSLNLVPALASIHGLNRDLIEIQIEDGSPFLSQGWRAVVFFLPYGRPIGRAAGILKRARQCFAKGAQTDKRLLFQSLTELSQMLRFRPRTNKVMSHFEIPFIRLSTVM